MSDACCCASQLWFGVPGLCEILQSLQTLQLMMSRDDVGAQMLSEMCASQGCTKDQCALEERSCKPTAIACAREYLECSRSSTDRCSCAVQQTKCMSDGGCVDKDMGLARIAAYEMCLSDGCDADVCEQMAYDLEVRDKMQPLSRAAAVRQVLNNADDSAGNQSKSVLGTSSKSCQSSTLRCSGSYAACMTRVANVYEWIPSLVRSGYAGLGKPFDITDEGKTLRWPGMDGSAAARVRTPLPRSKVSRCAAEGERMSACLRA